MSPIICIIILINIIHKSYKLSMKNEIRSKCNESNTKTIVVSDELNDLSPLQGNIKFKFANNTLSTYALSTISCINPYFFSSVTNKKIIEIALPSYISSNL